MTHRIHHDCKAILVDQIAIIRSCGTRSAVDSVGAKDAARYQCLGRTETYRTCRSRAFHDCDAIGENLIIGGRTVEEGMIPDEDCYRPLRHVPNLPACSCSGDVVRKFVDSRSNDLKRRTECSGFGSQKATTHLTLRVRDAMQNKYLILARRGVAKVGVHPTCVAAAKLPPNYNQSHQKERKRYSEEESLSTDSHALSLLNLISSSRSICVPGSLLPLSAEPRQIDSQSSGHPLERAWRAFRLTSLRILEVDSCVFRRRRRFSTVRSESSDSNSGHSRVTNQLAPIVGTSSSSGDSRRRARSCSE